MPPRAERIALRLAVRGFVAVLVVLGAIPAYLTLAPAWRPLAARLACALLVATVCVRLIRAVRGSVDEPAPSALETPAARAEPPELDERFLRLRDELRFSTRSRQYFQTILWPQLSGRPGAEAPALGARRRLRRDGPPLGALERLIAAIETRA